MYRPCNITEGEPARLYRSPCDIRYDMDIISKKIRETSSMLNVRNILLEILSECGGKSTEGLISELELMIEEAKESLNELKGLHENLKDLAEELEDAKWIVGM